MTAWSRRGFLGLGLAGVVGAFGRVVSARAQGLDKFMVPSPACKDDPLTPGLADVPGFRPDAPRRSQLVEPGMPGTRLSFSGLVSGLTCGPIAGARVDLWQADGHGVMDARGSRLHGYQLTGPEGQFRFETIEPGSEGTRARRLNVRVNVPGRATLTTQLFFPDDPRNVADTSFRPELLLKIAGDAGSRSATFNVVLNL
jgi:Dioxygenase